MDNTPLLPDFDADARTKIQMADSWWFSVGACEFMGAIWDAIERQREEWKP